MKVRSDFMGLPLLTRRLSWRSDLMTLAQCYPSYGVRYP
jgi:hypothetical protein